MRDFINIAIASFLFCGTMLWLTREQDYGSQSLFAEASNVIWYHAMHLSGVVAYSLLGRRQTRWVDYIVALGLIGIVATNVYKVPMWHNGVTAFTFLLAVGSMIYHSKSESLKLNVILGSLALFFFGLGLFGGISLFLGEQLAELCIGVHLYRRNNINKDA